MSENEIGHSARREGKRSRQVEKRRDEKATQKERAQGERRQRTARKRQADRTRGIVRVNPTLTLYELHDPTSPV